MESLFDAIADRYDESSSPMFAPEVLDPAVDFLYDAAAGGTALELAIGTGRVALPLQARGVDVHGIELSEPMVAQMRAKHGGDQIPVTIGDMATTSVGRQFDLVYVVWNSISNLLTQQAQVQCFRNAAAHLKPRGKFVIELWIPQLQRLPVGGDSAPITVTDGYVAFDKYELAEQRVTSHHYRFGGERVTTFATPHRYIWPAECDLMAQIAGLERVERWADFRRTPFTSSSESHASVWQK